MALDSMNIAEKGFDSVWDARMFSFIWKYVQDGISLIEYKTQEKGIKLRVIIEATKDNIDHITLLKGFIVRLLDDIKGNFGIFDNRAYMVFIFNKGTEVSYQTLWSNSKVLVDKQQELFNILWEVATPLALRRKELEQEEKPHYQKILTDYKEILNEIDLIIKQSRKELLIFSSMKILHIILYRNNFLENLVSLLRRGVMIRILTDNVDEYVLSQVAALNNTYRNSSIQYGYTNKLGSTNEMVIVNDGKLVAQIKYDEGNNLEATVSNEEHTVLVQEILFEKYWNEVKSLEVVNSN